MTDPDFPQELRAFIQENIPNIDAAELLLVLARSPDRPHDLAAIAGELRPTVVPEPATRRYLMHFKERGLVVQLPDDNYQYHPVSPEIDAVVRALTKAYNERPVTLVRLIYSLRDEKIRSFADAFRLKKP